MKVTPAQQTSSGGSDHRLVGRWLRADLMLRRIKPMSRKAMGNWRPIRWGYLPKSPPCGTWDAMTAVPEMFRVWICDVVVVEIIPHNGEHVHPLPASAEDSNI